MDHEARLDLPTPELQNSKFPEALEVFSVDSFSKLPWLGTTFATLPGQRGLLACSHSSHLHSTYSPPSFIPPSFHFPCTCIPPPFYLHFLFHSSRLPLRSHPHPNTPAHTPPHLPTPAQTHLLFLINIHPSMASHHPPPDSLCFLT